MKLYPILIILIFALVSCKQPKHAAQNTETADYSSAVPQPEEGRELSESHPQKKQELERPNAQIANRSDKNSDDQVVVMDRKKMTEYLVTIEGNAKNGSGSIVRLKGNSLIATNAHVLSGNQNLKIRTLDSRLLNIGTLGFARDYDLAVAMQDSIQGGLEVMQQVDKNVSIGDDVLVLGNSQSSGVITEISGKVTGIGPELVEVDAKFVAGNSGSPIIHVKTGKVIAIATFATIRKLDTLGKDSNFTEIRRFGYRLDTVPKWEFRKWDGFQKEGDTVAEVERNSENLIILLRDIFDDGIVNAQLHQDGNAALIRCVSEYLQTLDAPPPRMPTPKPVNISDIENRFSGQPLPNESGEDYLERRKKLAEQGALGPATLPRNENERRQFQEQAERRRAQLVREAERQAEVEAQKNAKQEEQLARTNVALARQNAKVRFLRNLAGGATSDIRTLNLDNFTDFHAKKLRKEIEFREMVEKELKLLSTKQDNTRVITLQ